jgi:hypothetical protein
MRKKAAQRAKRVSAKIAKPRVATSKLRVRKAPILRALRLAHLFDLHGQKLLGLVGNWHGEATPDQKTTNDEIAVNLGKAAHLARQILLDVDMLQRSGFAPTAGRSASAPLRAGERVAIKPRFFNPAVYGKVNNFEVVVGTPRFVRIKSIADPKWPQSVVPRAWLDPVDETEVDDSPPPPAARAAGEREHHSHEADDDVLEDAVDEVDPDNVEAERDPRLPNPDED